MIFSSEKNTSVFTFKKIRNSIILARTAGLRLNIFLAIIYPLVPGRPCDQWLGQWSGESLGRERQFS